MAQPRLARATGRPPPGPAPGNRRRCPAGRPAARSTVRQRCVGSCNRRGLHRRSLWPRVSRVQPPAASTLRTQSDSGPQVSATSSPPRRRKTLTGVRYSRPLRRPRWMTTPKWGRKRASGPRTRLVAWRLKRATERGSGIKLQRPKNYDPRGFVDDGHQLSSRRAALVGGADAGLRVELASRNLVGVPPLRSSNAWCQSPRPVWTNWYRVCSRRWGSTEPRSDAPRDLKVAKGRHNA